MIAPMLRELSRRPSLAVGVCTVVVLTFFALRGDLRLSPSPRQAASPVASGPLVLQNPAAAPRRIAAVPLHGRVFDALGFLVVGAEIVPTRGARVRTDADGAFATEAPTDGVLDLLVRAAGLAPNWRRTTATSPDALIVQLQPSAPWDPPAAPLPPLPALRGEGLVRAADGRPLAAAYVTMQGTELWACTDDMGRYSLPLAAAAGVLTVHQPDATQASGGHALAAQPFVSARDRGIIPLPELIAAPAAMVRGIVHDARGEPQEGVPVRLRGDGLQRTVASGVGGAFRIGGLWPGRYRVEPMPFRGAIAAAQTIDLDTVAIDIDLELRPMAEARLLVVDQAGAAVGDVFVAAAIGGVRRGVARTDAEGFVSLPIAAAAEFEVRTADTLAVLDVSRCEPDAEPPRLVVARP
jgi:Carboxypeptidase regulatory-like domain